MASITEARGSRSLALRSAAPLVAAVALAARAVAGPLPAPIPLEEMTITGTRSARSAFDTPQSVSVVSGEEIASRQLRTTPQALREETGILVQETNYGGGSPFVRGQIGNRILVLIDGVRLNNSTFRFGPNQYLNVVDSFTAERIEVVRGPASVLYGSDALGGVVNVVTRRREDFSKPVDAGARVLARFASAAHEGTLRVDTTGNRGAFGFLGGATARRFGDLRSGRGEQDHTGYSEVDGDARLQWRFAPDHEVAFGFQRVHRFEVPNTVAFAHDDEAFVFDPEERTFFVLDHRIEALPRGAALRSTVSFHDQREVRRRRAFESTTERREEDQVGTIGFTAQADVPVLERHLLTGGIDFYRDQVDSRARETDLETGEVVPRPGAFPDGSTYRTIAGYLQATIDVWRSVELIAGARYSGFALDADVGGDFGEVSQSFDGFTRSVALVYEPLPELHLVGTVSEGFRAPNLDDSVVLRAVPEQNGTDAPNPALEPETVDNYEIGVKSRWLRFAGSLFYYRSEFSDLIERRPGLFAGKSFLDRDGDGMQGAGEPQVFTRQNVGDAIVQGVEADFTVRASPAFELFGNFSWARGENETAGEPFSRIPPMIGLAGVRFTSADQRFWIEYWSQVAAKQDRLSSRDRGDVRIPPGGTPGWQTQNLRGGRRLGERGRLLLALENLTDESYRIHGSGIDAPGWNALASLEWTF